MEECEVVKFKVCFNEDDCCYKVFIEVIYKDVNVKLIIYSKGCIIKS